MTIAAQPPVPALSVAAQAGDVRFAAGGIVQSPDGSDSVPLRALPGEHVYDRDGRRIFGLAAQAADVIPASDGGPVPGDETAISMFTAHRLDDGMRHLAHATERMQAARATTDPDLRAYHSGHIARHLEAALGAGHDLVANIREHYPAEAAELEQVKEAVGLAKAVSEAAKVATTAHLTETVLHELTHAFRHAQAMLEPGSDQEWSFNSDHAEKHLAGALEHVGKLTDHFRDNYPSEGRWLTGLQQITSGAEDEAGHAQYAKGTVSAQMANPVTDGGQQLGMAGRPKAGTISRQFDLSAASRAKAHATASATARATELRDERGRWAEGEAVHEHLGKPALSKSQADTLSRYQGSLYHQMDAYLNTGDIHAADDEMGSHVIGEPEMGKQVRNLDSIFKSIPPTTKPLVVYRGMTLPGATPGTVWTDKTPVSTSSDRATGEQYKGYAEDADPGHAVLARITVPPGSKALSMKNQLPGDYSQAQQEAEVLLPRNSQFRITGVSGGVVDAQLLPAAENVGGIR